MKIIVAQSCPTLCDPMNCIAHQAPLSIEFSRQEYRSGWPCPPPGDLPNPGIEPGSPALQADSLLPDGMGQEEQKPGHCHSSQRSNSRRTSRDCESETGALDQAGKC